MAEIRSLKEVTEKWTRVTPGRVEDYRLGIEHPRRDWADETFAAADVYKAGVDAAHAKGLFAKGVKKAGTSKWKEMALKKGPGRFAEGVYIAGPAFEEGFAPYHAAIEKVDLGPRYPKRDPRNLERVKRVVDALVAEKLKG